MLLRFLQRAEENIIAFLLVAMTLLVFADVVMRFGFGTGLLWSQELTLYLSAWFVMFGISYGLKVGAHIGVDAVVKMLPTGMQRVASSLAVILSLVYCGLFLYGSWIYLHKMFKLGIGMEDLSFPVWFLHLWSEETLDAWRIDLEDPLVPLWISQSILIIGFSLFSIRLLELLWGIVTGKDTGFRHKNEAEESMHLAEQLAADKEPGK
ncbi:MAG: TRAP transporter small permease [Gammaproteobacteria bacterium]